MPSGLSPLFSVVMFNAFVFVFVFAVAVAFAFVVVVASVQVVIPKRSEGSASNAFNGFAFAWVHVVIPLALTTEATEERLILRADERPLFDLAP